MAYEAARQAVERALSALDDPSGDQTERLIAARDAVSGLGKDAAVPAGLLDDVASYQQRIGDSRAFGADEDLRRRLGKWLTRLRAADEAAVGNESPSNPPVAKAD